jgi:hypothetical protein
MILFGVEALARSLAGDVDDGCHQTEAGGSGQQGGPVTAIAEEDDPGLCSECGRPCYWDADTCLCCSGCHNGPDFCWCIPATPRESDDQAEQNGDVEHGTCPMCGGAAQLNADVMSWYCVLCWVPCPSCTCHQQRGWWLDGQRLQQLAPGARRAPISSRAGGVLAPR